MENNNILTFTYIDGEQKAFPAHPIVKEWMFTDQEYDEAAFLHFMAIIAEKYGMDGNHLMHLFPAILRMLGSKSEWADVR